MNCNSILRNNGYEKLTDSESVLELNTSDIKQAEIDFFNDDGSCKSIVVEENLRTSDLCLLLALKNHVAKDVNWAVVEEIEDLGLARSLEDHEEVLKVYLKWKCKKMNGKFYFRKDFRKYEIFTNPEQFFPLDMIACDSDNICLSESTELTTMMALQDTINTRHEPPRIFSHIWFQKHMQQLWKKAYFLLDKKTIYYSLTSTTKDVNSMICCANIEEFDIYSLVKAHKYFKVPTEYCFCLKAHQQFQTDDTNDIFFACENEKMCMCWVAGLRLAKFGKQLRDNFKSFTTRVTEISNSTDKEYTSFKVSNESARTRVAMDFTGNEGKIVVDPKEAEAIAIAEGYKWNKKFRSICRRSTDSSLKGLDCGIHITQPWFHSGLSRDDAVQLLLKYGSVNGVFLIRESSSNSNTFVLSFIFNEKVYHTQIQPIEDNDQILYSLDNGKTKFYDILQLVEFHQLNSNCLPTKLTHYIVQTKDIFKV